MTGRGLAETREKARALILAGAVRVNGQRVDKAGHGVAEDALVEVTGKLPYVSRGGVKLAAALDHFGVAVEGKVCADIGTSTGGFTDCLLQRGAVKVHAVDVGPSQMDWRLRNDPRVVVRDHTNARYLEAGALGEPVDLLVCDVSFISVTLIAPRFPGLLRQPGGEMVILVKPQFEVGRADVGKGGIVKDPALHGFACRKVQEAVERLGYRTGLMESPIEGGKGNREFLLYAAN